ncbi:serine/threonine protein phosphatase [Actinoplanes sp. NPDC000266]
MYRLAGPGFNAWRELASSPLLRDWRVLPGRPPVAPEHRDIDAVVRQFGDDPAVRARFEELAAATHSLVLFFEYLPHPVSALMTDPVAQAETVERQLFEIVASLRARDLLHMDAHFGNMRTDGTRIHLVDFGLATSPRFDLSDEEREFVTRNTNHDADYMSMRLTNWLVTTVCGIPVPLSAPPTARDGYVRRCATGDIPPTVPPPVAEILARHAPAAARMNAFCHRLFDGDIHAEYPGV